MSAEITWMSQNGYTTPNVWHNITDLSSLWNLYHESDWKTYLLGQGPQHTLDA